MKEDKVVEFIHRRFPNEDKWLSGNCYYFALILKDRFNGDIYYDPIDGHFLCLIGNKLYDWTGEVEPKNKNKLVEWLYYSNYDANQYNIIRRDCLK